MPERPGDSVPVAKVAQRCPTCGGSGFYTTYSYHQTHSTPHLHRCPKCNTEPLYEDIKGEGYDLRLRLSEPLTDEERRALHEYLRAAAQTGSSVRSAPTESNRTTGADHD